VFPRITLRRFVDASVNIEGTRGATDGHSPQDGLKEKRMGEMTKSFAHKHFKVRPWSISKASIATCNPL